MLRDTAMTLPDDRSLAYTDCGDPNGVVALYFHGAPTSRLDLVGMEEAFEARGLRVISPDRPGYGRSSPQPGRGYLDWPGDVAALVDLLDIQRCVVVGISSGGPYAVACAALLPERVGGLGVLGGVTDMGWPDAWEGYDETDAAIMRLGNEADAIAWCEEHYGADGSRFLEYAGQMAPADLALLEDEVVATGLLTSFIEAFRQGVGGLAVDLTVQGRPWPFDPGVITGPAKVLHGEADPWVPLAHGRHTADLIPGATFVPMPEHGHVSLIAEIPQLCTDLTAAMAGA